ncbi:MAG: amidohydrolase family protein [Armatimonadetes bacterium]|nr:amidohydrolase family protein [Armatimonadota bacterium]
MKRLLVDFEQRASSWTGEGDVLVPGLVDVHCHGVDGFDVMRGEARKIGTALRARGVEWFCPTTVTASWEDIRKALEAIGAGFPGFAGVHLEGPFINPKRPGAQSEQHISAPAFDLLEQQMGERLSLLKIVTLAPEILGALHLVRELVKRGIVVSAGHSDATFGQMAEGFANGVTNLTHFYNAMRPFSHRDPGAVGYGLTRRANCELIYDRAHVAKEAAELLLRCRGPFEVIGISDGTMLSGMPDGAKVRMWGLDAERIDGCARLAEGTLAGSASTLVDVFTNLWQDFGPETAIMACSENPRRLLGLPEPEMWLRVASDGQVTDILEGKLSRVGSRS